MRKWKRVVKGKVQEIDIADDGTLWCTTTHGFIGSVPAIELENELEDLPTIRKVGGNFDFVTANTNDDLWAIDSNKNIFRWKLSEDEEKVVSEAATAAVLAELEKVKSELSKLQSQYDESNTTSQSTIDELNEKISDLENSKKSLIEELNSKNSVIKTQEQELIEKQESIKVAEEELANKSKEEEEEEPLEKVDFQEDGAENGPKVVYEVIVKTGSLRGSGTDSRVYIKFFGDDGQETCEMYLDNSPDNFSTGRIDHFTVRPASEYPSISKILLGHDNSGFGPSWFVDYVKIRNNLTQELIGFHFGKWFSTELDDGLIARESTPIESLEQDEESRETGNNLLAKVVNYKISIITGDRRGAGTDSQVFVQLFGENGESMQNNMEGDFDRGSTVICGIQSLDLGNLEKIRVGHNNTGWGPGWFLDKVIVRNESSGQQWFFLSGQWYATDEDDGEISRTIESSLEDGESYTPFINYTISVITGDRRGAGTDANVTINLYGENGNHSGDRKLESSANNFERNQTDEFGIESIELGELTKIRIGHDNHGWGAGWFLDKVIVTNTKTSKKWFFLSGSWFATSEDDGSIVREIPSSNEDGTSCFPLVSYSVSITTGDRRGAGTDSIVSIAICGDKGDTGDRILDAPHDAFERSKTDQFTIEAVDLGLINKIRIGHDNSGWGSAWFLDKVCVRNESTGEEYYFLCGKWLQASDGSLIRELPAKSADGTSCRSLITYKIDVITGDRRGAGTSANVHILLFGENGDSGKRFLDPKGLGFSRNETETFGIEAVDLGKMNRIEIGHDNSGWLAGWFLDKVIITNQSTGEIHYFLSGQWFDSNEGDGQIVRELLPQEDSPTYKPLVNYKLLITTGDRRGAGTNANVTATVYGEFGDSGILHLDSSANDFERGSTDQFQFQCPELGEISKIRIGHDDSGWGSGWFLDKIILEKESCEKKSFFLSGKWFDKSEDDGQIQREIPVSDEDGNTYLPIGRYKITVITGDRRGAGTDAKVTATIYGENGDSGPIVLENSINNFERNSRDEFGFDAVDLGSITRLKIGHDNSGFGAGWFLDKVIVTSEILQRDYYFPIGRWLATDEDDGQIYIEKQASEEDSKASDPFITYKITVFTGDRRGAGTDANVFIELTGENAQTSGRFTLENENNNFERNKQDIFGIESVDLGKLQKITIGHDGSGFCSGWFLDKVMIQNMSNSDVFYFICGRWLASSEEDGCIVRELLARDSLDGECTLSTKQYAISIFTGDRDGAGTSANVSITLCGENGNSGPHVLDGDPFERNGEATFQIEAVDLGNLRKIRIQHDNSGIAAGWFLEKVKIEKLTSEEEEENEQACSIWYALCGRWLSDSEDDGSISRELPVGSEDGEASLPIIDYNISIITGDRRGAGTNANVSIEIFGCNGSSGIHKLENAKDNFERNKRDEFQISCVDLGKISRIRIAHDGSGWGSGWFLDKIIIHSGDGDNLFFHHGRWLATDEDDGQISREIFPSTEDQDNYPKLIDFRITVLTGDRRGAGTDANVFIQLYGENGQIPESILESPLNNFERNKQDTFVIQGIDIGKLTKIRVGHDNSGWGSAWFLDKVIIECEGGDGAGKYYFLSGKWFSTKEDDGLIVREIPSSDEDGNTFAPLINYKIEIKTGDRRGAGTNSNVFICLTGEKGDTGDIILDNSSNNFERNQIDIFGIQAVDLGKLTKIRIGHDNSGFFSGWFLENVTITNELTQESFYFFSGEWFDSKEGDGQIVREISSIDDKGKSSLPEISYEISILTGDRRGAGTDANVFIELFGENGSSGKRKLEGQSNNFERNQLDKFNIDAVDLGLIKEINIGHDGSGWGSGWFLEKVTVRNPLNGNEFYFLCGRWLASDEDDGKIVRQLTPSNEDGKASLPLVDYTISVFTGDRRGAGTDANVCIKIKGSEGTYKQLLEPDDKNSFRRNKTSNFGIQVPDLGVISRIAIGHNDKGWGSAWFLDKVKIRNEQSGSEYFFLCGNWLASNIGDNQIVRTLTASMEDGTPSVPIINYKISVVTGDRLGAGTDSNVSITIFGDLGDSGSVRLDSSGNDFERNQTDSYGIPVPDLGELTKIRIGHDDSGWNSAWFLDKVIIENPINHKKWWFLSGQWFDKSNGDKQIIRDIVASNEDGQACLPLLLYTVQVTTGNLRGSGTDANVFINIIGSNGDTGRVQLAGNRNSFEKSSIDVFGVYAVDLGEISQIEIGHDGKGWFSGWYLERVKVRNETTGVEFRFPCGRWLDEKSGDGSICASLLPSEDSGDVSSTVAWQITVQTGDVRSAGCNANVFLLLFGEEEGKETEKISLQGDKDSFSRGKSDVFMIESENVGCLSKIRIGHDGSGGWTSLYGAAWYLATVNIKNMHTNEEFNFEYNEWLQKQNLVVELFPQ